MHIWFSDAKEMQTCAKKHLWCQMSWLVTAHHGAGQQRGSSEIPRLGRGMPATSLSATTPCRHAQLCQGMLTDLLLPAEMLARASEAHRQPCQRRTMMSSSWLTLLNLLRCQQIRFESFG